MAAHPLVALFGWPEYAEAPAGVRLRSDERAVFELHEEDGPQVVDLADMARMFGPPPGWTITSTSPACRSFRPFPYVGLHFRGDATFCALASPGWAATVDGAIRAAVHALSGDESKREVGARLRRIFAAGLRRATPADRARLVEVHALGGSAAVLAAVKAFGESP